MVPLRKSGSGLKTVLLVLLNLLVVPHIEGKPKSTYVFAFEELENNLHPALLRRLLQFIEKYVLEEKATVFLTTHSSTALDLFGISQNAQIVHITHDGQAASVSTVKAHFDQLNVISELGAKPSDLLQANGIIWVEGPSDCIYINRWIDIVGGGALREGRDYQCAFYGGALLARMQFKSPEEADAELVNLIRVNPNIIVVCDGDRTSPDKVLKPRVKRILEEVQQIKDAHAWITDAKEIESYIPGSVLSKAYEIDSLPDPGQYECFFSETGDSYFGDKLKRKTFDKVALASLTAPLMSRESMQPRFDWLEQMTTIIECIQRWNQ